jgi:hypothetical protein
LSEQHVAQSVPPAKWQRGSNSELAELHRQAVMARRQALADARSLLANPREIQSEQRLARLLTRLLPLLAIVQQADATICGIELCD